MDMPDPQTAEESLHSPKNRAAYERVLPFLGSVEKLAEVNLDVATASLMVLVALPALRRMRAELATLTGFDIHRFDQLEDFARAARHACTLVELVQPPRRSLRHIARELVRVRGIFLADARALAARGRLDPAHLKKLKGARSHRGVAADVLSLVELLRERVSEESQKQELNHAAKLAEDLESTLAVRTKVAEREQAKLIRQRVFTLVYRVYDRTRSAVGYLRWEQGDAEEIAPSLYKGHGGRGVPGGEALKGGSRDKAFGE